MLLAAGLLMIAVHVAVAYRLSAHVTLPAIVVAGILVLAVLKHMGLLRSLYRHRSRGDSK